MDDDLRDLLSEFAGGVDIAASKTAKRLLEIGRAQDAGDILRRAELLSTTIKRAAGRGGLRVKLSTDSV